MSSTVHRSSVRQTAIHIFLIVLAALWLFPLIATGAVLVKDAAQFDALNFWQLPGLESIPGNLAENFRTAWTRADIGRYFFNSVLYATLAGLGSGLVSSLAAFALIHLRVHAAQAWFLLLFVGNIFPFQMFLIPLYVMLNRAGLYDTRPGLLLVYLGITIPFALFVYRNYAMTLPHELFDAAAVDGADSWRSFTRIFLPLTRPAIIVVFIFQFTWTWNDLLFGLVLSERARPIMTALSALTGLRGGVAPATLLAGAVIAALPPALLLLSLQGQFVRGFVVGTEKG